MLRQKDENWTRKRKIINDLKTTSKHPLIEIHHNNDSGAFHIGIFINHLRGTNRSANNISEFTFQTTINKIESHIVSTIFSVTENILSHLSRSFS